MTKTQTALPKITGSTWSTTDSVTAMRCPASSSSAVKLPPRFRLAKNWNVPTASWRRVRLRSKSRLAGAAAYDQHLLSTADSTPRSGRSRRRINTQTSFNALSPGWRRFIRDLLAFSRTNTRRGRANRHSGSVGILSEALSVLQQRIEASGAQVWSVPLPKVRGSTARIGRYLFRNLLSNALKYVRHGYAPEIHVSTRSVGEQWVVSVRDNGIGFHPQYAERIFGLFKRLHKEEYPGQAWGLRSAAGSSRARRANLGRRHAGRRRDLPRLAAR